MTERVTERVTEMVRAMGQLELAIRDMCAAMAKDREGRPQPSFEQDQKTREEHIELLLDEIPPLNTFSATHLDLLGLLIDMWAELAEEGGAPKPETVQ